MHSRSNMNSTASPLARTTGSSDPERDVAWVGSAACELLSFTAAAGEALTTLQPSDGDELIQAAAASARARSRLEGATNAEHDLPNAGSITSAILAAAGSTNQPQCSRGPSAASAAGSEAGSASNGGSAHGRSGSGVATSLQVCGAVATGPAGARSPAAMAANAAAGAEYTRTSERIRSMNRRLASHGNTTKVPPQGSAGGSAPGALKNSPKPARISSARTSLRAQVQPAPDKVAHSASTKHGARGPARNI